MATDFIQAAWQAIRAQLEEQKATIYQQITSYPPPIPACDAQFNYLLEARAVLDQELRRLQATSGGTVETLRAFVDSSPCLDAAAGAAIMAQVGEQRAAVEAG